MPGVLDIRELPSGSWRVAAVPPDHPDHNQSLLQMRELLWPALRLVAPARGSRTAPRMWEGGPIGVAAHYLGDPRLNSATTMVRLHDGERQRLRVRLADRPDSGTVNDLAWTVQAWRRFGYAYRAESLRDVPFAEWLVPEITVFGRHVEITVPGTDPYWAAMLLGVLQERRCCEPRLGKTPILGVTPVDRA